MLWTISVVLIILWILGLGTGFTMGSFIHILIIAAVALLLVSLSQEAMINRKLRHVLRSRDPKPVGRPFAAPTFMILVIIRMKNMG